MKKRMFFNFFLVSVSLLMAISCSVAPKGEISSSAHPQDEITRLRSDLEDAQIEHVDVLASEEYLDSVSFLQKAEKNLGRGKSQEKVINDLRFGRGYLRSALLKAESRREKTPELLEARQRAIEAGMTRIPSLKAEWIILDERFASNAGNLEDLSSTDIQELQDGYANLEKMARVETLLGHAKAKINGARKQNASQIAPRSLRKAEMSLNNAELLIGSNLSQPAQFQSAVNDANREALFLTEVVRTIQDNGKSMKEATAIKLVVQDQRISYLDKSLSASQADAQQSESDLDESRAEVKSQDRALQRNDRSLASARNSLAVQAAMESAREKFNKTEADTYQQGEKLVIRLKSMSFRSGQSELSSNSKALLQKVTDVARDLNAKEIKIEGHTDSSGSRLINETVSTKRADNVAAYLKENGFDNIQVVSEGHGFEHPIATNKTKAGRALNRRVDVVITPTVKE